MLAQAIYVHTSLFSYILYVKERSHVSRKGHL